MPRKAGIDAPGALHHVIFRGIEPPRIWAKGKHPETVQARSLLCFWACRQLGMKTTELAESLKISQPSVSESVRRGEHKATMVG